MLEKYRLLSYYVGAIGLLTQCLLLAMQIGTYRRTGETSLRIMAFGAVMGVAYFVVGFAPMLFGLAAQALWVFFLVGVCLFTAQIAFTLWGFASILEAFEAALRRNVALQKKGRSAIDPET